MINARLKGDVKLKKSDILKRVRNVEVGFFDSARYNKGAYVAQVAFWQDAGTTRIPPRPFFRNAIRDNHKAWLARLKEAIKLENDKAYAAFALNVVNDIQSSIDALMTPPLKASTIRAKKSSKPLIDTGKLRQSIEFKLD